MKRILIPTDYSEDTLQALEYVARRAGANPVNVVLLSVSPLPVSTVDLLFLREDHRNKERQDELTKKWRVQETILNVDITMIHVHQYGASEAVIRQLEEKYDVNEIVIPSSIWMSKKLIHELAMHAFDISPHPTNRMPQYHPAFTEVPA